MSYRNKEKRKGDKNSNIEKVIHNIKTSGYWSNYPIEKIAQPETGDAFIIAEIISEVDTNQLRKFYNEAIEGKRALVNPINPDVQKAKTTLAMLVPRIMYSMARGHVTKQFVEFMKASTNLEKFRVKNKNDFLEDYNQFIRFFEAVVGYHKYIREQK